VGHLTDKSSYRNSVRRKGRTTGRCCGFKSPVVAGGCGFPPRGQQGDTHHDGPTEQNHGRGGTRASRRRLTIRILKSTLMRGLILWEYWAVSNGRQSSQRKGPMFCAPRKQVLGGWKATRTRHDRPWNGHDPGGEPEVQNSPIPCPLGTVDDTHPIGPRAGLVMTRRTRGRHALVNGTRQSAGAQSTLGANQHALQPRSTATSRATTPTAVLGRQRQAPRPAALSESISGDLSSGRSRPDMNRPATDPSGQAIRPGGRSKARGPESWAMAVLPARFRVATRHAGRTVRDARGQQLKGASVRTFEGRFGRAESGA